MHNNNNKLLECLHIQLWKIMISWNTYFLWVILNSKCVTQETNVMEMDGVNIEIQYEYWNAEFCMKMQQCIITTTVPILFVSVFIANLFRLNITLQLECLNANRVDTHIMTVSLQTL